MKPAGGARRMAQRPAARPAHKPVRSVAPRRGDALERQAHDVAARFVDGGQGLRVSAAPAAAFHLPGSVGEPLPLPLRQALEQAFGADLRDVRVHADRAAALAAQALGARAFASGRHLAFGAGQYQPGTGPGRRLIAHEVAHTVQQAGRATHGGRLRVAQVDGSAPPQCENLPEFKVLKALHAPAASSASRVAYDDVALTLAGLTKAPDPKSALAYFVTTTLPKLGALKLPHQAESLLYDACKEQGLYELAAQLIERDSFLGGNRVNTVGFSHGLVDELEKRNGGWAVYAKAIASVGWLKDYERAWLARFEEFLMGAGSTRVAPLPRTGAGATGTIGEHLLDQVAQINEYKALGNNEWVYYGLMLMYDIDFQRANGCIAIDNDLNKKAAKELSSQFSKRRLRAQAVIGWSATLHTQVREFLNIGERADVAAIGTALKPYLQSLGKRVGDIGRAALAVWEQAVGAEALRKPGKDADPNTVQALARQRELAGRLGAQTGMPPLLARLLRDLNRSEAGEGRRFDPLQYRERVKPWLAQLADLSSGAIASARLVAFRAGNTSEALAWIALDDFVLGLRAYLAWTASESVATGAGSRAAVSTADEASFYRVDAARRVRPVAEALAWTDTTAAADEILKAALEKGSLLAIRSFDDGQVFKLHGLAGEDMVARARKDFGGRAVRGLEPLTLDTLALFYRAVFYRDLAAQLVALTPASDKAEQQALASGTAVPYLAGDAKKALVTPQPQRWYTQAARFAPKAGDKRDFSEVLLAHPAYQDLRAKRRPPGFISLTPLEPEAVFVWFVPPFDRMLELLRASLVFQGMVAATFDAGLAPAERFKRQKDLELGAWVKRLQTTVAKKLEDDSFTQKEWPGLLQHLYALAKGEYDAAVKQFRNAFIVAMRRDRQVIARRIIPPLDRFAADHHDMPAIREAIGEFGRFNGANSALEDGDREMQLALLMLEVAPQLKAALGQARGFDVVSPMLGFTEQPLARAQLLTGYSVAQRRALLPDSENSDTWIKDRLVLLQATVERLRAVRDAVQKASGFLADKDRQHIVTYVKLSSPLQAYEPLFPRHGGILGNAAPQGYRVAEVLHSFVFHPSYGDAPGVFDANQPSGFAPAQFLEPDGKTNLAAGDAEPLLRIEVIEPQAPAAKGQQPQYRVVRTIELTRKNAAEFDDLYNAITWAGFASAMGNIEGGIKAVLEFYLDVAELLPGVGPALAATRISVVLADFLTSPDYQALLATAKGGLIEVASGLLDALTGQVDTDQLMLLLLFGDARLEMVLARSTIGAGAKAKPAAAGSAGRFGPLTKMVDAFRRLGRAVFKALCMLNRDVARPMQEVRVFGSTRPLVSFALHFAADHIFQILDLAQKISLLITELDSAGGDKKLAGQIEADLKLQQQGFGQRLHQILKALEGFRLPHTVIDISPAIAAVLDLAESYVLKHTGFAGKVINLALRHSGAYGIINQHFAQAIVDAGADPNIYWRTKILPQFEKQFNEARKQVVARINQVLQSNALKGAFDPVPPVAPMTVTADPNLEFKETKEDYAPPPDEADMAPQPSADRPLVAHPAALPRVDGGVPLPPALLGRFESQMGQDLRHVRLHAGAVGHQMTDAFGADALTSGSHVFVRPGKLADTIDHELVHVVQQTGTRPLGRAHDSTPVASHPERGLDYRPETETQAQEVAAALRRGAGAGAGFGGGAARRAGLQPTGVSWFTVARLMRDVSNLEAVSASAKETAALKGTAVLPKEVQAAVDKVLALLKAPAKNAAVWRTTGPFTDAMGMVEARLASATYADPIAAAAKVIALKAMEPVDAKPDAPRYLSTSHFERHLEAFVLAKTGLGIALNLNGHKAPVPGKDFETVDLANPVKQIALVHIHLPFIDGRAPLWAAVIDNTWPGAAPDFKIRMRRALRALLESKGIQPGIWPLFGRKFVFSKFLVAEAETYLKQLEAARPDPVPSWEKYVETKSIPGDDVGLRLGDYDPARPRGTGRQLHHLTQYLVAQFFANGSGAKAFDGTRSYPGVFGVGDGASKALHGGSVGKIADKDGSGQQIDVATTEGNGRGAVMPTLSLASVTHRKGQLHVTPVADDEGTGTTKSQATALKKEFQRHLPTQVVTPNANTYDAYVKQQGRNAVAGQIYRAVQQTYSMVEHHMSTQLAKNMPRLEYQYYSGLVEGTAQDIADKANPDAESQAQKDFRKHLEAIPGEAKRHNHDTMLKYGWKTR